MISKQLIGNNVDKSGCKVTGGNVPAVLSVPTEIRTRNILNTQQKLYHLSQFARLPVMEKKPNEMDKSTLCGYHLDARVLTSSVKNLYWI
jgi:hypothetical protein